MRLPFFRTPGTDLRAFALPAALLAAWTALTLSPWVDSRVIVPPLQVLASALTELGRAEFYQGVAVSLSRALAGFALGGFTGVGVGLLLGLSPLARLLIGPTFHSLRQISLFAWLPLLGAIAGPGHLSKVLFIAFSAFYPVVLATVAGVRGVSQAHAEVARVYGLRRGQVLGRLVLPSASPQILSGLKLGLIYAWLATLGAEFLLNDFSNSLGMVVIRGRAAFRVEVILFGLLVIGLIGWGFHRAATAAERHFLRWRAPARA